MAEPVSTLAIDQVAWHARVRPTARAVVDLASGVALSYAELDALAARATGWLGARLAGASGERVAFLGRNGVTMLAISLACQRTGNVFVPLNWRLAAAEIAALAEDCAPALAIADSEFGAPDAIETAAATREIEAAAPAVQRPVRDDDLQIILYTSGTTGQPKGVMITARNAFFGALNFALVGEVTANSVVLSDLPMFHTIGLLAVARTTLSMGGTLVLTDRFVPTRTLAALADGALGVTHYFAVPTMAVALEREPAFSPDALRRLHAIFVGGSTLPESLVERFLRHGVPLVNGYGMSEAGTVMHMPIDHEAIRANPVAVGFAVPHLEVRLVAADRDVAPGEVGEIWLRGPSVSLGYWQRPAETAAAFTDGWYRSGDLARQDENGAYRIVDRLKDMYVSGGENVYPAEIEVVLLTHPGVADAAVVGVPDTRWGEVGVAFVVPRSGATLTELAAHCAGRIARYKCPARFVEIAAIPRSAAGKALKAMLRDQLKETT